MENFILRQKWLGLLVVAFVSLGFALHWAGQVSSAYVEAEPIISQEAGYFLPIKFAGGEIVSPQNTLIERSYGTPPQNYKVVLNTKTDDLNLADLTSGIYITRNKVYSYDAAKGETKIQSLSQMPDVEITQNDVQRFMSGFGTYLKPVLSLIIAAFLMLYFGLISLFYTLLMSWFFKRVYNADFALTLRVNVLACVALFILNAVSGINFGFIVTLILLSVCNYLANILISDGNKV